MDKYELVSQIGDGTFGSVAKAISKKTGQVVAIKKMKQKFYTWEECVKLPEVDVVRRLHGHPNIVKLREVIRENNELFFVFEFMDDDLLGVIKKAKQAHKGSDAASSSCIPYPKVKSYMRQLLQSLAYIHKRGYFHRDLKPENLLVKREGQGDEIVKLADFGLVKEIRARAPFTDYVSTRWYRAPELLLQDRFYSSPVDIWAAGCIMSELMTTLPLFPGTNEVDQLYKIMTVLGSPTEKTWPGGMALARKIRYSFPAVQGVGIVKTLPSHTPALALDLLAQMLTYDPKARPTAEQCLQHPFFSVGIDEASGPSAAALDQLALAAKRLQAGPQSAPAVLKGGGSSTTESPSIAKAKRGSVEPSSSDASHLKFYILGNAKDGKGAPGQPSPTSSTSAYATKSGFALPQKRSSIVGVDTTVSPQGRRRSVDKERAPFVAKLGGLKNTHVGQGKIPLYPHSPSHMGHGRSSLSIAPLSPSASSVYAPSKAKNAAVPPPPPVPTAVGVEAKNKRPKPPSGSTGDAPSNDVDLDDLMTEFATEISSMGVRAQKHDVTTDPMPKVDRRSYSEVGMSDPLAAFLNSSRYKSSSITSEVILQSLQAGQQFKSPPQKDMLTRGDEAKKTEGQRPDIQGSSVSPSIKALLAKHRNSGFGFQ